MVCQVNFTKRLVDLTVYVRATVAHVVGNPGLRYGFVTDALVITGRRPDAMNLLGGESSKIEIRAQSA